MRELRELSGERLREIVRKRVAQLDRGEGRQLAQLLLDDEQLALALLASVGVGVGARILRVLDDEDVER